MPLRFARAFAQRATRIGEMATADVWAYVVGGPCPFVWTDHEHKHSHVNTGLIRADIVWWRDPQFTGQADVRPVRLVPSNPAGQWIRTHSWQQRSSGSLNLPSGLTRPVTVMDVHNGEQERETGLSAVNCSVGWLQA